MAIIVIAFHASTVGRAVENTISIEVARAARGEFCALITGIMAALFCTIEGD